MLKRSLLAIILVTICCLSYGKAYASASTTFKLRILPKDCIFTVLDVGSQTLFFITPKICEPPPPVTTSTNLDLPLAQLVTYEDPAGKTTFTPPAGQDAGRQLDIASISANDLVVGLLNQAVLIVGFMIIGLLWVAMVLTLALGTPGLRKAWSVVGHSLHH